MSNSRSFILLVCVVASVLAANPTFGQTRTDDASRPISEDLRDIVNEQSELRSELHDLEQETRKLKQRLATLDRLAEVQKELDHLFRQIEQADSTDDEKRTARLESRIEPLERHLKDLRKQLDAGEESDERLGELTEIVQRLNELNDIDEASNVAKYLTQTIESVERLQGIHAKLESREPDAAGSIRHGLERQADELQKMVDADEELVELAVRLLEALDDDRGEKVEDMLHEISDLRKKLQSQRGLLSETRSDSRQDFRQPTTQLTSGEYFITQSWSQEENFRRPYHVSVPQNAAEKKLPVFIFMHGNGGNAREAMRGFARGRRKLAAKFIMVFAQGYRESWNIVSERSKTDDKRFIEAIVLKLASYKSVDANNFTIMGASNGAAMVNQLMIESRLPNIRNYISGVSPLNVFQYDGENFKAKGKDNNYSEVATPMTGKRLLNISGTEDKLVPYGGGTSKVIPAKDGKLAFVGGERSTFLWAQQMGFAGEQLSRPTRTEGIVEVFSYLGGDVVHYKVNEVGHGATHEISEQVLLDFLDAEENDAANVETQKTTRQPR